MKHSPAIFDPKTGELAWRGFWKSPEDMRRLAEAFETGPYPDAQRAAACREALAKYERYHRRAA